jgi:hypothetical protein
MNVVEDGINYGAVGNKSVVKIKIEPPCAAAFTKERGGCKTNYTSSTV